MIASRTYDEIQDMNISSKQHYGQKKYYFHKFWNLYDITSQVVVLCTILIHFLIAVPICEPIYQRSSWPTNVKELYKNTITAAFMLQADMTFMIASFLLAGGRVFKYFTYHASIRVFVDVFVQTFKTVQDFVVWFMTVVIWLTIVFYLLFALQGANTNFDTFSGALNSIALLTFGFYDYDTIYNGGLGFGAFPFLVIVIFWLLVFILIMFGE